MSRIGKLPITIPGNVTVNVADSVVHVKGPKGELSQHILPVVAVTLEDGKALIARKGDDKPSRSAHGLTRTLIANMVEGVTKGFRKSLEIQGVGYRVAKAGEKLNLSLGYSHPIVFEAPQGIAFTVEGTTKIHIDGIDKQRVGQTAAEIRDLRAPEPYKGKGIRYEGEFVRKKLGKAGKAAKK
ncbi:MAG TPA: 50S ribosomal protein L6 [Candidatus Baltobacteraceae bacterium]